MTCKPLKTKKCRAHARSARSRLAWSAGWSAGRLRPLRAGRTPFLVFQGLQLAFLKNYAQSRTCTGALQEQAQVLEGLKKQIAKLREDGERAVLGAVATGVCEKNGGR